MENQTVTPPAEIKVEPKIETKPPEQAMVKKDSIEMSNGIIIPKNIEESYRYATAIHKSGLAPKQFDSAEKIMVAMQMAQELQLPPLTALKSMYVINGTPALFGDLPLALVRKSGLLEYIKETQFDATGKEISAANSNLDEEVHSAQCIVKRKGDPSETIRSISWVEAQRAELDKNYGKEKTTYKLFRKRMLQMRSRSTALKDVFPDVLMGVAIQEYDNLEVERDVTIKTVGLKKSEFFNSDENEQLV